MALAVFAGAAQAAPPGSCDDRVAKFDAYLRAHPNATGDLHQTVGAQLMHQPTRNSVDQALKEGHQHLLDLLAKAQAEQKAGDEAGCRDTLAEVEWMSKR